MANSKHNEHEWRCWTWHQTETLICVIKSRQTAGLESKTHLGVVSQRHTEMWTLIAGITTATGTIATGRRSISTTAVTTCYNIIIIISYHITDLKRHNCLKAGTDKPKLKVKMQSVSGDDVRKTLELAIKDVSRLGRCYIFQQGVIMCQCTITVIQQLFY